MTTQQIEFGEGRVWTFTATGNVTSGNVVTFEGTAVKACSAASQHAVGVALIPASNGRPCAVMMEGICRVYVTGAAVDVGDLLGTGPSAKAAERTWSGLNERNLDLGVAIEGIGNNSWGKIKLLW